MPTRETAIHLVVNANSTALNGLLDAATLLDGSVTIGERDNGGIGAAEIHGQFPDPDRAQQFVSAAERAGARLTRQRLTRAAVLSWVGSYGNVRSAGSAAYGGSITRGGLLEELDENTIRIVPRGNLGGLDLGPSTFGSATAGDVAIDDVIDITPY